MNRRPAVPVRHVAPFGFTLIELMMVVTILAGVLLLVPTNLSMFGARSRLENSANVLVSLIGSTREQAILDGQPVRLQLGQWKTSDGEVHDGFRIRFTNLPATRSSLLDKEGTIHEDVQRPEEREWLETAWTELSGGVKYVGVSERFQDWKQIKLEKPYEVEFDPDGSVEKGFAVRIESVDLKEGGVSTEHRTFTVIVNPLTAEASNQEGLVELPAQRDDNEFPR